jgi:putative ABC transport system permease protein
MSSFWQDVRFGWRSIRRRPLVTIVAVLSLVIGVSMSSVVFSLLDAAVLSPLDVKDPRGLALVLNRRGPDNVNHNFSYPDFTDYRAGQQSFVDLVAYSAAEVTMRPAGGVAEVVQAELVSGGFFPTIGPRVIAGRGIVESDDQPGAAPVIVMNEVLWRRLFGGPRAFEPKSLLVNDREFIVIGIVESTFHGMTIGSNARLWAAVHQQPVLEPTNGTNLLPRRGTSWLTVMGRLKPGATVDTAAADLNRVEAALAVAVKRQEKRQLILEPGEQGDSFLPKRTASPLQLLLGAALLVLLVACANVANLILARATDRGREIAVRTALGASRRRVVQQILCETILLWLFSGAVGALLARGSLTAIVRYVGQTLPRASEIDLDARVLLFTLGISLATGIIAGLAPAWRLTRPTIQSTLNQGLTRTATGSHDRWLRGGLVVSEVALALVLLAGAGLLIRTIGSLRAVDPGFDERNVLTATLALPQGKYPQQENRRRFADQLMARIRTLPGVETVSAIDSPPMTGGSTQPLAIEGAPARPMAEQPTVAVRRIMSGYARATRMRLLAGRDFSDADTATGKPVVLVSESMAKQFWPNDNPIGKRLTLTFTPKLVREVVGVVGDVKMTGLDVAEPVATIYAPFHQSVWGFFTLVIRTTVPPKTMTSALTSAVHEIDAELPLLRVLTMEEFVSASFAQRRFAMELLGAFALFALLLAAIGIYSVLSWTVRQRVREIGIRRALGATVPDVIRMVVVEGLRPTMWGVACGVVSALALSRLIAAMVFGVSPHDAATLTAVAVLLTIVGVTASLVPAYRAARIDPAVALRDEP